MRLLSIPFAILGSLIACFPVIGPEPLKLVTHLAPGPYFVGQAIEIRVEVEGIKELVGFEMPKSPALDFRGLPIDPTSPSTGRFLVIPKRAGSLEIPPFRAKTGDRSGSSRTTRLTVSNVPIDGRSASFLGGVGAFEVKAEGEPTTLRLGQSLEYRIKLSGPAAWSSDRAPDLSGWASLGVGFRVEGLPDVLEDVNPPIRTFRYRLRPKGAGRVVLPPVAIAAFDPKSGRFATRTTSSVPVQIDKPPTLDPDSLDYRPIGTTGDARLGLIAVGFFSTVAGLATLGLWIYTRKNRRQKPADPVRLARELGRSLDASVEVEPSRRVMEALTTYLERVGNRSTGVLTPPEAREAFGRLTEDGELAERAEKLIMACDRAAYGRNLGDSTGLIDEGRSFFERVARVIGGKGREERGPREAAKTA
jgi:hypothetical protein